ncbi:uncharacterized protein BDR25DRAFT_299453 [Lindgomyces ingoldianus]|uniref:Uncharacterized protein n=1 Tax=Lindgomyces ingoldianus TaxID=673940 RepID=A0ACB6RE00_9PLEO|nr:uncharacterized protein BDR25DRAFT_299453 [Lindgomyces ingoldianus]KAF2477558.1 hypothetical protein BDR25DRAFT_299453 [Lindgomyces ingoldianus]
MDPVTRSKLTILRRQYFQLVEPTQLRWPDVNTLKSLNVQLWIFENLFDMDSIPTAPPDRYRLRVLKLLVCTLEASIGGSEEDEISDELMSTLSSLISSNIPSESVFAQQKAFVTYAYPPRSTDDGLSDDDLSVKLLESRSVISSSGTTGLRTWEAALLLGAFLASETGRRSVHGKNILELGAGTGMLSIFCAKHLSVSSVVATDGDEAVVDIIKTNIFLNSLDADESSNSSIRTAALRWGWSLDAATFEEDFGMDVPDVLLGADVTYDRSVIPSLVSTLREFFKLNPALRVLIAAAIRNEQTFEIFQNACIRNGFNLELTKFPPVPEHLQEGPFYSTTTPIQIWQISRSQPSRDPFSF